MKPHHSSLAPALVLVLWVVVNACQSEPDAAAWHRRAQQLLADAHLADAHLAGAGVGSLRALPAPVLASAIYCEQQALTNDATYLPALEGLGDFFTAQGSFEQATIVFRQLVELRPDAPQAYAGLGRALAAQGRFSGAMRAFQDALRRDPDADLRLAVYNRLGHTYQALGHQAQHLRSADATYRAALRMDPEQADILYQLARVLIRLERPDEALPLFRKALELAPDDAGIRIVLATAYVQAGRREAAMALLRAGLALRPDAQLHFETGRLAYESGQRETALAAFVAAQLVDSTLTAAALYEGRILAELARAPEALMVFQRLRRLQPEDAAPRISAGIVLGGMGRLAEAETLFREALKLDKSGDAAVKLGGLLLHQGHLRDAQNIYTEGVKEHPDNAELQASLGDVYLRLGVLGAALVAAEAAVRLEPDSPLWQFHLANTYDHIDPGAAPAAWERYLELAGDQSQERDRIVVAESRLQKR